jgi:hypothetical protein
MVAAGPGPVLLAGGVGGIALAAAAWWRPAPRRAIVSLVILGTVPITVAGWTVLVPLIVAVLAGLLAVPITRSASPTAAT